MATSPTPVDDGRRSLLRGRLLLIAGIVLLGISLRSAVTGMSPFLPEIRESLGMGASAATLLGMLPTLALYTWIGSAAQSMADAASAERALGPVEKGAAAAGIAVTVATLAYAGRVANRAIREAARGGSSPS